MRSRLRARDGCRGLKFGEDLNEDDLRCGSGKVYRHVGGDAEAAGAMLIDCMSVTVGDRKGAAHEHKRHAQDAEEGPPRRERRRF